MSKKPRKRQRVVGRTPQSKQIVSATEPVETEPTEPPQVVETPLVGADDKLVWESECVFQQHYKITVDESRVKGNEERVQQVKRMLRSLLENRRVLYAVCEWLAYLANEDATTYIRERYGDMNADLEDILGKYADCFALEDREDLYLLADALGTGIDGVIQLEPSGFEVSVQFGDSYILYSS